MNEECKCGCEGSEQHPCPFKWEILDDKETTCNCCDECKRECLMDI